MWINNEISVPAAILWAPGEPSNNNPCVHLRYLGGPGDNWAWGSNDFGCNAIQYAICEKRYNPFE